MRYHFSPSGGLHRRQFRGQEQVRRGKTHRETRAGVCNTEVDKWRGRDLNGTGAVLGLTVQAGNARHIAGHTGESIAVSAEVTAPPSNAQLLVDVRRHNHDASLDHDLPDGDIDLFNEVANFSELVRRVGHHNRVGALVDNGRAPLGNQLAALCRPCFEKTHHVDRIGVTHPDKFRSEWCEFRELLVGFNLLALSLSNFLSWRHHQYAPDLTTVEPTGFEYEI